MVRAVIKNGEIRPLSPLPASWQDGQQLIIDVEGGDEPSEIEAWAREIGAAAETISQEDHDTFLEALAEHRTFAKQQVRDSMDRS